MAHVRRGLEGVVAAQSAVSTIAGGTLTYRGYAIEDLAHHATFEETAYLLWHGSLPNAVELKAFAERIRQQRALPAQVCDLIASLPGTASAMSALRTVVSALAAYTGERRFTSSEERLAAGERLLAQLPTVVAYVHLRGLGQPLLPPDLTGDGAGAVLALVRGGPAPAEHARILNAALVVHADHELNASTFAARIAASTLADVYAAVVAALATLQGPLHGGAGEAVAQLISEAAGEPDVDPYVDRVLARSGRLPGFGHIVYEGGDPRAAILKQLSGELAESSGDAEPYRLSRAIEQRVWETAGLHPNVDFYAATVYRYLQLPPSLHAPLFAMSRVSGWIAHILEQYGNNRLIRPRADYIGVGARPYTPLHER